jgi:hypothetical protein
MQYGGGMLRLQLSELSGAILGHGGGFSYLPELSLRHELCLFGQRTRDGLFCPLAFIK